MKRESLNDLPLFAKSTRIVQYLFSAILLCAILGCCSCKRKCISCINTCYNCSGILPPTICNSDYTTDEQFKNVIATIQLQGYQCTETTPTREVSLCDDEQSTDNFKYLLSKENLTCSDK